MAIDITLAIIAALIIGAAGGFVSSVSSWLSSDEPFSGRKNIKALLVGTFAGLALGVLAIGTLTADISFQTMTVTLVTIFLSAVGVDQLTSKVSGMVTQRSAEKFALTRKE